MGQAVNVAATSIGMLASEVSIAASGPRDLAVQACMTARLMAANAVMAQKDRRGDLPGVMSCIASELKTRFAWGLHLATVTANDGPIVPPK